MSEPMSDERLLDLKQMCANAHRTEILVAPVLMGEALDEIDRLRLALKPSPDLAPSPGKGLDGYRETFLREAIIAAGTRPAIYREGPPGEPHYVTRTRTPAEAQQWAIKLWAAYRDIHRGTP